MRALTTTAISYGLQNIPVRLCTMVKSSDSTGLSNACPDCKGDVGHQNICKSCGKNPETKDLLKGFKIGKDDKIIFTQEQINEIKSREQSIQVLGTMPKESIDQRLLEGGYYVLPDKKIKKAWQVLYNALSKSSKTIVVSFALRSKEHVGILTVNENVMVLYDVAYYENLVQVDEEIDISVSENETKMGLGFIDSLKQVDLKDIRNTYAEKFEKLVEEIVSGKQISTVVAAIPAKDELSFFQ